VCLRARLGGGVERKLKKIVFKDQYKFYYIKKTLSICVAEPAFELTCVSVTHNTQSQHQTECFRISIQER
jgi:hypothetical protein